MKFFSTVLAAFAVGSAVAAPLLAPCTSCADESGVGAATVPSPCTAPGIDIGGANPGQVGSGGHVDNTDIVAVVNGVLEKVTTVTVKVEADLEDILAIGVNADVDAQTLVSALVDLQVDLKDLLDCVPILNGLTLDVNVDVAQLKAILALIVRVEALVAKVQVCLGKVVGLPADILAVISIELNGCLDLIVSIATPIVACVLALVANVTGFVDVVLKITTVANTLTSDCSALGGILAPVFKLANL
jgi:hypothetical protein